MSEIDFAEIEKAMAELVSKAQGKERQEGLHVAAQERSQIAKEIEVAKEQGDIATKRIIVASNHLRSDSSPRPRPQILPPAPGRVMDFKPPATMPSVDAPQVPISQPKPPLETQKETDLQKTVGQLSNEYLVSEVSEDSPEDKGFTGLGQEESQASTTEEELASRLENIAGPSPAMNPIQEPTMSNVPISEQIEGQSPQDRLPEADKLAEDIGRVHKIYGQKLPKEYLQTQKKDFSKANTTPIAKSNNKNKVKKLKQKRGFSFYFVLLMIIVAIAVWGLAVYLYFIY